MKLLIRYLAVLFTYGVMCIFIISFLILPILTKKGNEIYLPDVRNYNILKAEKILKDMNFNIEIIKSSYNRNHPPNDVISMLPRAYTKVKKGRTIKLKISGEKDIIILEDFKNLSLRNTKLSLDRNNLIIDTLIYEYSNFIKKDVIIAQYPIYKTKMKTFDKITLIVSLGTPPDYYIVPDLVNVNFKRAKDVISKSGLKIGKIKYEYSTNFLNNTILEQNLTAGMKLSFPHNIDLIISTDRITKK